MTQKFDTTPGGLLVPTDTVRCGGVFSCQLVRKGEVIDEFDTPNLVTNQGLDNILEVMLRAQSSPGAWSVGIFQGNYTPVASVTAATITAAANECVDYSESTRPTWTPGAVSARAVSNSASRATFTFTAARTIYGAFLVNASAKSATTGILLAAARFATARTVATDDQLLMTYNFSMTG